MDDLQLPFPRCHPLVASCEAAWTRTRQAYAGGRGYIDAALVKHMAESAPAFRERKERAYCVNLPRKIARLISNFLLSVPPQRDVADAELTDDWSRHGYSVDDVMLQVSTMLNCHGLAWVLVDMPSVAGPVDLETKQKQRVRVACGAKSTFGLFLRRLARDGGKSSGRQNIGADGGVYRASGILVMARCPRHVAPSQQGRMVP